MKKKINLRWRIVLCMLLSLGYYANSFAIDYYWIGKGTTNNWSLPGNWATTSGASVSDVLYPPTKNDNVIFDENSFPTGGSVASRTITINTGATCDSFTFRDIPTEIVPVMNITVTLAVGGSATLWPGMTVSGSNGTIKSESERTAETFTSAGVVLTNTNIVFAGNSNYVANGNLTARDITLSGDGNRTFGGYVDCKSFVKTGTGNVNITSYLQSNLPVNDRNIEFSGGGDMTVGGDVKIESVLHNYSGVSPYLTGGNFTFAGNGNLTISGDLYVPNAYISNSGNVDLSGSGTKIISGDVTAGKRFVSNGGTVNVGGDLIILDTGHSLYSPSETGTNPKIFGGCKMTIAGHIKGDSSLSISGTGTDVKVNGTGDFSEFYDLYIVTGAKFTHQDVIVLKRDWNSSGGVSFTTATAPSLIRINTGNFTANATDVYDNVEFFGLPFAGRNYHTINQGTYNKITFSAGSGSISTTAGITTKELIINSEAEYVFSNTTTVNNRLEIKPQRCGGMIQVTNGTIAMGAGSTVVAENLLLTNNTITGGTFTATNSVDKGGNSGWNFSNTPKTLYWVGGTGDWNDISHWANSSGGAAGSGCIPALLDNVVFNGTSGLSGSQTVSVPAGYHAYCNNMTWTGTGTPVLKITDEPNTRLYIGGSLELALGMTIDNSEFNRTVYTNITSIDRRGIYFVSTRNSPYETIRTNGVEIMGTVSFISGAPGTTGSGGWVFQDDWAGTACIYFERGSLNTNGKALTATWFRSTVGTRTLNIAGSTITLNDAWSYYGTGSNFLTNAETANSLIKIILPDYGDGLYYANNSPICGFQGKAGEKYNNLDFSVAYPLYAWDLSPSRTVREGIFNKITLSSNSLEVDPILGSGIQTDSLILTGIQGAIFTLSDNITVNKYLESPQGCGLPSILRSSSTTSRTITMGGLGDPDPRMNVKMKNTVINNVKITGGPIPLGGYYAEDCDLEIGTETGWNPVSSAGNKRYYWVGGNGDWNEIEHWSDRSDGPGSVFCTPPSAINTVVFDHNSFKANNCVVTISDSRAKCDSMLWVGTVSETPKLLLSRDRNSKLTVWGSMLLQQNMTVSGTDEPSYGYHSEINFKSQRPKESLVTNEVKFEKVEIIFNVSGEWSIPHKVRFSGGQSYHLTFDGTSTAKWIFGDDLDISTPFGEIHFNRGTLDLSGITVNVSSRFTSSGTPDPNRKLIIKNTTLNVGSMTACMWNYNGILTAVDSYNSVINFKIISINMTTAANQVYNDVNFSTDPYYQASSSSTINAPAGANTTQFRKVTFGVNQGIVNNGKFEYLHFKNYGTMNTIEADTLRFNNNNEYIYTFISGTTSTINEKWYGSGLPCYRLRYQSSVEGDPAFVRVKKEAATYIDPVNGDVLFLDFIRVNDIIVSQGPGLALIEKGPGSPDDEVCWDGRTYNLTSWMTLANGWIRTPYDPVLRPMPDATIRCANFPYVIDPYQFVTTPESTYEWRKGGSAGTILNPGDPNRSTWTINSAADAGLYYLKVDYHPEGAGKTCLIDGVVMISTIASDSLVWTGQIDTDWNKPGNWYDPAMFATSTFAPTACTDVLIPKNISRYPNLTPGNTDYSQLFYERASCHHIWFEHGGEVVRTDSLNYLKAHVELTLAANRWNMITAPLRYMYPGDYYKNVPCPHEDQLRIYQQLFAMSNPQTGVNLEGNWTEP
ncbi:MAG: hypothetical protein LBI82_02545, partial [Dysgonamonadaceae bacterium]|nr:hypothetical protein [Dysgonamonadaceae bacterium]